MNLPNDHEAELGAIGCCLCSPELATDIDPEWFFDDRLAQCCRVIRVLGEAANVVTVGHRLKSSLDSPSILLAEAMDKAPTSAAFSTWRNIVLDNHNRRKAIEAAQGFLKVAPTCNGDFPAHVAKLADALQPETTHDTPISNGKECAVILTNYLEKRWETKGKRSGIVTGFHGFDAMTDGLQFGEQTIIAARPSIGKTAIAGNIVSKVCLEDKIPTLFVSLEMSRKALLRRMLVTDQRVPMASIRAAEFTENDFRKFTAFNATISKAPLHILEGVGGGMDSSQYAAAVRRYVKQFGIRLVITDYLQKIKSAVKQEKKTYEVAEVSGVIRALAVSTGAAFLTLAQLNREPEKDKGRWPRLSDLADSGQIERDADTVALLHRQRDGEEAHKATLVVAKQRDGETGPVELFFDREFVMFKNP